VAKIKDRLWVPAVLDQLSMI